MLSTIALVALLFVMGVILIAIAKNTAAYPYLDRVAWILWAVAAVLWWGLTYGKALQ